MKKESGMIRSLTCAVLALSLMTGAVTPTVAGQKTSNLTPTGGTPVKVAVGGKEQTYYTVGSSGRLKVKVDGPGKLTVISRILLPSGSTQAQSYSIRVWEKGTVVCSQKTESDASGAVLKGAGTILGKLRKFHVDAPPGSHVYEVGIEDAGKTSAAVKLQFGRGKSKAKMANLQPVSYSRVATAVVKEKLLKYYVCAKDRGVQLRVIGPTRLKVTTRLNYDASMKGGQKFGLGVWEGDKRIKLKSFSTSKALAATYQDWKDVIPGKAVAFTLAVPSGEHYYYYKLEEGMARSVSLRFSIPQKDLKNE